MYIAHYGKGHDDNPPGRGSGRYPYGSRVIKGRVYRFSNKNETELRKGAYVSKTGPDVTEYFEDSINARLGFKDYEKIYMMKMDTIDPIKVRTANAVLEDMVKRIGDKKVDESYAKLKDAGYFSTIDRWKRYKVFEDNEEMGNARNQLGKSINRLLYQDKKGMREQILDEYRKQGYDAIVDPEDYVWNYQVPMIILNNEKFSQPISTVMYDKSQFNEAVKLVDKNTAVSLTAEDKKRLREFMKS
jgi:hypothetical protein